MRCYRRPKPRAGEKWGLIRWAGPRTRNIGRRPRGRRTARVGGKLPPRSNKQEAEENRDDENVEYPDSAGNRCWHVSSYPLAVCAPAPETVSAVLHKYALEAPPWSVTDEDIGRALAYPAWRLTRQMGDHVPPDAPRIPSFSVACTPLAPTARTTEPGATG